MRSCMTRQTKISYKPAAVKCGHLYINVSLWSIMQTPSTALTSQCGQTTVWPNDIDINMRANVTDVTVQSNITDTTGTNLG